MSTSPLLTLQREVWNEMIAAPIVDLCALAANKRAFHTCCEMHCVMLLVECGDVVTIP
ncbi:hypothetical protein Csa_002796 [Cucumis sativus]|uniref:Uncharacterized protein n=1 Tax=Cucumis sativus TaxID=3659 RepID=A0A0A0KFW3_CUCSA|nr:hypothetical protein Csa_002796 [Cucumis sativus]